MHAIFEQYPRARKVVYLVSALIGLALGATQVGYGAASAGQPTWLTVALAVYAFLTAGLGVTSATNVNAKILGKA